QPGEDFAQHLRGLPTGHAELGGERLPLLGGNISFQPAQFRLDVLALVSGRPVDAGGQFADGTGLAQSSGTLRLLARPFPVPAPARPSGPLTARAAPGPRPTQAGPRPGPTSRPTRCRLRCVAAPSRAGAAAPAPRPGRSPTAVARPRCAETPRSGPGSRRRRP